MVGLLVLLHLPRAERQAQQLHQDLHVLERDGKGERRWDLAIDSGRPRQAGKQRKQ